MTSVVEPLSALGKSQVDSALEMAAAATEGTEKLLKFQIKTAKAAFGEGTRALQSLAEIKNASALPGWTAASAQPDLDKATAYARGVYELVAATQAEIASLLDKQVAEFNKQAGAALDAALKAAPPGSEAWVPAVKAVLESANTAYESLAKAGKQLASLAEVPATTVSKKKAA